MLHVWLRAQHSPLAIWHEDIKQWQAVDGWQQLHDIYSSYNYGGHKSNSNKNLCLYFPSSHVQQVDTELNTAQLKQLGDKGQQYLFEETSLTAVEQLAVRKINHANNHYLYALAQSDIEVWQQSATLVGMSIVALLPDFLLLPPPEEGAGQQVTLYQDDQTMLLRQSSAQGLAVSYLPLIFERFPHLSEVMLLPAIETSASSSINYPFDEGSTVTGNDSRDEVQEVAAATAKPLPHFLAQTAALIADHQLLLTTLSVAPSPLESPERHPLNFFSKATNSQLSPYLRVAMMVALSALILQIATDGVQSYQYSQATAATKTAVAAQYQSWFPNEPLSTRTKLAVQVQPKLRSDSQAAASHMAVLARISPLIKQSSLHAQALIMEPSALNFTLIAPDRNSLDQFATTLATQGLSANLERVNSNEQGQFSGQMTVKVTEDSAPQESTTPDIVARS